MKLKTVLCSLALGLAGISSALASPQVTMNTGLLDPGRYQFDPNNDFMPLFSSGSYVPGKSVIGDWYGTFCLEHDEDVIGNHVYDAAVSQTAQNGGINTDSGDKISAGTAYLYKQFVLGTLGGGFVYNSPGANLQVQRAIWYLEDETGFGSLTGWISALLLTQFTTINDAKLDYVGNEVYVMNLTHVVNGVTILDQDQLVYKVTKDDRKLPDGGTTAMLLGLGLLGLALAKRRL